MIAKHYSLVDPAIKPWKVARDFSMPPNDGLHPFRYLGNPFEITYGDQIGDWSFAAYSGAAGYLGLVSYLQSATTPVFLAFMEPPLAGHAIVVARAEESQVQQRQSRR